MKSNNIYKVSEHKTHIIILRNRFIKYLFWIVDLNVSMVINYIFIFTCFLKLPNKNQEYKNKHIERFLL